MTGLAAPALMAITALVAILGLFCIFGDRWLP